jgi:hypothetical protein
MNILASLRLDREPEQALGCSWRCVAPTSRWIVRAPQARSSKRILQMATRFKNRAFSQTDFTEDLKNISVPVLVMHGDDDQIVPYADSRPLSAKLLRKGGCSKPTRATPMACRPHTQTRSMLISWPSSNHDASRDSALPCPSLSNTHYHVAVSASVVRPPPASRRPVGGSAPHKPTQKHAGSSILSVTRPPRLRRQHRGALNCP